ncbi:PQQ-binding-like beta-propeller repeat protein [Flavihumibacter fluvii]|uniref:outer membrane protein assembly factor BamB family protein n=1 Tax=Flavihumibacter fluvii TaxID=2838157 RepID=UPI001BDF33D9|nr:PQQ-binding-like beta-propeller repeat protein [Flavihumibacter fluvii]ULQ54602.1 PQQ-binding-like beta-propeller repeat protein [Flavihumibacter fluvii]
MLRLFTGRQAITLSMYWTIAIIILSCKENIEPYNTWPVYRGDKGSSGYSSLSQINTGNLDKLELAWTYHSGDAREGNRSNIECNPIIVNGMMYVTSPKLKLVALDPETGKEIWTFDPFLNQEATGVNRGVTYWSDGKKDKRIFFSAGPYVYALQADHGNLVSGFGDSGRIDLRIGLGRDPVKLSVWSSSPGIIYKNLLIQGSALEEGYNAAPGFVRAYNVQTGKVAWTFNTIPQPGEFGYDTWEKNSYKEVGGTNSWAGMSIDEKRGIVFIPLGSPAFDFYGGNRKGENLFGNCLLAVDAATGQRKWHYQLVHHDLWDYDLPAPPTLVTVQHGNKKTEAVAQVTKMGMVFLFDRITGKPLFPIEERPVPKSNLLGEETWATQPFPLKPVPFVRQSFSENDITNISDSAHAFIRARIGNSQLGSIFTPPDTTGVVQLPGTRGGAEWGGASFDPETGILYVNANELPLLLKMKAVPVNEESSSPGEKIFTMNNCAMCHGANRTGTNVFPSLLNLAARLSPAKADSIIQNGKGQMPAFPNITGAEKKALLDFLYDKKWNPVITKNNHRDSAKQYRYVNNGWVQLTDQDGYPGIKPPWGTLNAIDLNKGEILWKIPLGEYDALTKRGIPPTGTQNLGGAIVTAGGLVIIAATADEKLRIFDKRTGKLLWQYKLPAAGYATPSTYMLNGKQYIVIAAGGGGKVGTPSGDAYVAFCIKNN